MNVDSELAASRTLGHTVIGTGPHPVVVLNDWLCDTSTWDVAREYLDAARFSWAFTDLRGYGRSRAQAGAYTLAEATADVLALADARGWTRFSVVGHSMSTLVALQLAQQHPAQVARLVVITPPPPAGFGADEAALAQSRALALGDDATRLAFWRQRAGQRLSPGWVAHKVARWRACSEPEAVAGYVSMFARDGLPDLSTKIAAPVLAITGEQDAEPMRAVAVTRALSPLCETLSVVALADSGHYPMQELPPLLAAHVERFLSQP